MHPDPHDLTALAYGLVEPTERETLLEHLANCDTCREAYDALREEQTAVREAIIRDARSGPAEARALERTLLMLEGASSPGRKAGGTIALWAWPLRIAAVLAIAAGVLFVLKPEPEPKLVQVAAQDRAPAQVEEGVVFVPASGAWQQAEAVPVDKWVKSGDEQVRLRLNDSLAELARNSIFRISFEDDEPVVNVLHGSVLLRTEGKRQLLVRAGEAGMYTLPGAVLQVACEGDGYWLNDTSALRSWNMPQLMSAEVKKGDVVLSPANRNFHNLPLRYGETVRWTRERMEARDAAGLQLPLYFIESQFGADNAEKVAALRVRLEEFRNRQSTYAGHFTGSDVILRDVTLPDVDNMYAFRMAIERASAAQAKFRDGNRIVRLGAHPEGLRLIIEEGENVASFLAPSLEALREQLPVDQHALLERFIVTANEGGMSVAVRGETVGVGELRGLRLVRPATPVEDE